MSAVYRRDAGTENRAAQWSNLGARRLQCAGDDSRLYLGMPLAIRGFGDAQGGVPFRGADARE